MKVSVARLRRPVDFMLSAFNGVSTASIELGHKDYGYRHGGYPLDNEKHYAGGEAAHRRTVVELRGYHAFGREPACVDTHGHRAEGEQYVGSERVEEVEECESEDTY